MAATHWHRKAGSLDYAKWDGTGTTDLQTLAGETAKLTVPALIVTLATGEVFTVPNGSYLCKDELSAYSVQTLTAIEAQWEEPA
jgi:hypothetical protein